MFQLVQSQYNLQLNNLWKRVDSWGALKKQGLKQKQFNKENIISKIHILIPVIMAPITVQIAIA